MTLRFSTGMVLDANKHADLIGEKKLSSSDTRLLAVAPVHKRWRGKDCACALQIFTRVAV